MGLGYGIVPGTAAGGSSGGTTVIMSIPYQSNTLIYQQGVIQKPEWANLDVTQLAVSGVLQGENADEYTAIFTPRNGCEWLDGSTDPKTATWVINRAPISNNFSQAASIAYDGNEHTVSVTNYDSTVSTISGNSATTAGEHIAVITPDSNHCWANGTYGGVNVTWVIDPEEVPVPSVNGLNFTYVSGTSQGPTIGSYDNTKITVTGASYTDAGDYTLTMELADKTNTVWANSSGSNANKTWDWSIAKANGSVTLSANSGTVTYGTPGTFTVTGNTSGGTLSVSSSNDSYVSASVSGSTVTVIVNEVNAATRTITVTAAATNNYNAATATYTVTSAKANGSVTLSATSGTVTYGTPGSFTVKTNTSGGTISASSAASDYVEASASGNTITVTTKKYRSSTVAITVTSAATTNYNAATATYTVTTARATGTLSISKSSMSLTTSAPSDTTTVTTNSNGTITATPANSAVCSATVSGTIVTIKGKSAGDTTVTIAVAQSDQYTAPTSQTVSVSVPAAIPTSMTDGNTLANIKTIFANGQGANYFKAGDYFDITFPSAISLDSSKTIAAGSTYRVVCLGIDHNSSKEGTKRGHFCIGKDTSNKEICFEEKQMNSSNTNSGGWNSSAIKTWLNGTFYNALPTDLKNVITECTKYTDNTGNSSNTSGNVTSTSQKIWLLAEYEVFGARSYANQYEQNSQAQYDYYKNGNSKVRYGHSGGSARDWWLRSPGCNSSCNFCNVYNNGIAGNNGANTARGVVPGFTIS